MTSLGSIQYIFGVEKSFQSIQTTECRRHSECRRHYLGEILGKDKQKYFRLRYSVFGFRPKA